MKTKLIASALLALSVAASGSAFAQRGEYGNDRNGRNDYSQRQDSNRYDNDRGDRHDRYNYDRNDRGRYDGQRYGRNDRHDDARNFYRDDRRGGGPRHDLRRGQRLGYEYRDNRYVVNDWRARRLSAPPRGHHWVRAGNDYVLAAIATGLIAQVLLSNY
ncbi:RcnB family protein [Massilia yuzhufengensis]|uniref:Nickel/cobalt transporter regulator n=1 Tax=Massilia yuzhufengensis TaxID=1164594 RepID=A0A1I1VAT4_9BURK|nr:RcnB family protein [Massilia yuzhufengensis]SFD80122.1 Nickel/cobalt transporter regulator [Massilia yuzhufengensis]